MKLSKTIYTLLVIGCMTAAVTACSLDEIEDLNNSYENPGISATVNTKDENSKAAEAPADRDRTDEADNTDSSAAEDKASEAASEVTPTPAPTAKAQEEAIPSTDEAEKSSEAEQATPVPTAAQQPDSGNSPENPQPTATPEPTQAPTPTPAEASGSSEPAATVTPTPTPAKADNREEYWDSTFLIWVPVFKDGSLTGQDAKGTFDYAVFSDVTLSQAEDYVKKCKDSGFTDIKTDSSSDGRLSFKAANSSDWCVSVEYNGKSLTIGSGFEDSSTDTEDIVSSLYSDTMLQYIPVFTAGTYESTESSNDDDQFTYIYYSNAGEEDVRKYIKELKNAGYIYAPDEGDSDGIIWYIALNEDVFSCYVAYDNGVIKIGCGYGE